MTDHWTLIWGWFNLGASNKVTSETLPLEGKQALGCSFGFISSVKDAIVYDEEKARMSFVPDSDTQGNDLNSQ